MNRRRLLQLMGATSVVALIASCNRNRSVMGTLSGPPDLARFPEKTEMILLTDRPPQLELPSTIFARTSRRTKLSSFGGTSKGSQLPWIFEHFGSMSAATSGSHCI